MAKDHSPSDRKPRVLFLAGCWFPDQNDPFSGIFIKRHAAAASKFADVAVLHLAPSGDHQGALRVVREQHPDFEVFHVRYNALPTAQLGMLRGQMRTWRAGLEGCREVLRSWGEPDILHIHVIPSLSFVLAAFRIFPSRPLFVTEHWTGYLPASGEVLGKARRMYTRWLSRRAEAVTTVSADLRDAMKAKGFEGAYHVIPNVVHTDIMHPPSPPPENEPFRFVHVSLLRPVKNIIPTIRLIHRLVLSGLPTELHVVGDGPDKEPAMQFARERGLLDSGVVFTGGQDDHGIARSLRAGHALVLLSDYENSPCVIGEAMACGLPVLATHVGGVPELVTRTCGLLVPPGDWQTAETVMRQMITRTTTFDSAAIRETAVKKFSPDAVGGAFAVLYDKALGITD